MTEQPLEQDATRVTAIVVSFHRVEAARRTLARLGHPDIDVIVVNVEDDADVAALDGQHRVIPLAGNPGYAAAVNAGVAAATNELVVFLNDDAVIDAMSVLALVEPIVNGVADVTVPMIVDDEGRVERTIAAIPTPVSLAREWALLPDRPVPMLERWAPVEKWRLPAAPERVDAAAAVVVATRRSILSRTPLPESYFLYWEESEWFWRLRNLGALVQYRPEVVCAHEGGRDDVRPDKARLLARNAVRCVRRTQGRGAGIAAFAVVVVWNLRLLVVDVTRYTRRRSDDARRRVSARVAGFVTAIGSWKELR